MSTVAHLAARLRAEFPHLDLLTEPYSDSDDPAIEAFITLLGVPADQLGATTNRAWELAEETFGDRPMPVHIIAVTPEHAARHYSARVQAPELVRRELTWVSSDPVEFVEFFVATSMHPWLGKVEGTVESESLRARKLIANSVWSTWISEWAEKLLAVPDEAQTADRSPWRRIALTYDAPRERGAEEVTYSSAA